MLDIIRGHLIYIFAKPIDMRKSFDGLSTCVRDTLELNSLEGQLFVFRNKSGDKIKQTDMVGSKWLYTILQAIGKRPI